MTKDSNFDSLYRENLIRRENPYLSTFRFRQTTKNTPCNYMCKTKESNPMCYVSFSDVCNSLSLLFCFVVIDGSVTYVAYSSTGQISQSCFKNFS